MLNLICSESDPDRTSVSATSLVRRDPEDEQVGGQGLIVRDNIASPLCQGEADSKCSG